MGASGSWALTLLAFSASQVPARPRHIWLGVAALGLAAVGLGTVAWRRRRGPLQQVGTVAQLWIYPVKSCKGVSVSEAECTAMGLRCGHLRDRFWLVIDEEGKMVTARQEPRLVLISMTCNDSTLMLSAAYTKDLLLPVTPPPTNPVLQCRIKSLEVQGRDCGEAAAKWISSFLKTPCRLVHFEPSMCPRSSQQMISLFGPKDKVAYSDASPFLVLSEASLEDLNSRMEKRVKVSNFRPNIVISGCGVYAEDSWNELLIGDVELKRVIACARCRLTMVDPDTGIMDSKEPLETLKSYRLGDPTEQTFFGNLPLFGQYFALKNPGTVKVGDPVYLLS
ncbi:mitochondrial amidoxime-reducing component 1-like [Psammomys obesus]|uniref:mitochondrial amidoxime-reducing component 1-like n=1 Tax=Psammomys obesus TaxID=48139 RepID=UPI002453195F|nr:mitochondrial amidoxime-reducing component 1-like [Psammomys obesus]